MVPPRRASAFLALVHAGGFILQQLGELAAGRGDLIDHLALVIVDQVENHRLGLAEILELGPDHGLFRVAGDLLDLEVGKIEIGALHDHVEIHAGLAIRVRAPDALIP